MIAEHEITLTFKVGTVKEPGISGLKQTWLEAEDNGQRLALTSGAGLGNPLLEASIKDGEEYLYAQTDVRLGVQAIFEILQRQLAADQHSRLSQEIEHGEARTGESGPEEH